MEDRLNDMEKQLTVLKTTLFGSEGQGGIYKLIEEIREDQKKTTRVQNLFLGGLFVLNIVVPVALKYFV